MIWFLSNMNAKMTGWINFIWSENCFLISLWSGMDYLQYGCDDECLDYFFGYTLVHWDRFFIADMVMLIWTSLSWKRFIAHYTLNIVSPLCRWEDDCFRLIFFEKQHVKHFIITCICLSPVRMQRWVSEYSSLKNVYHILYIDMVFLYYGCEDDNLDFPFLKTAYSTVDIMTLIWLTVEDHEESRGPSQ